MAAEAPARHNLPATHDRFVGRGVEMGAISTALRDHHLVSLVGPGGAGKTRLAVEVARDQLSRFTDGVWLVPLGTATAPDQVPALTGQALRLAVRPGENPSAALADRLADSQVLLVLDNCEHLLDAVHSLITTLLQCPAVRLLATSREPLGCQGEAVVPVSSLPQPAPGQVGPAVELFVDRAATTAAELLLDVDLELVASICRTLDRLPLAIELAAARLRVVSVAQLAERLDDRFTVLTVAARGAPARHQTLEAALAWSYDLLDEDERSLFRYLSAFPGEFPFAAVAAIAEVVRCDPLDVLGRLVDKSLVITNRAGREYRYRLLESIREYGRDRLAKRGEVDRANGAMLGWVLALVAQLERDMRTPRQDEAIGAIQPELATARAAYEWALRTGDPLTGLRMLSAVPMMPTGQRFAELERLRQEVEAVPRPLLAQVHLTLANVAGEAGEGDACIRHSVAAAEAFDELGDARLSAWARYFEAMARWAVDGDKDLVSQLVTDALAEFELLGDELGLAYTLWVASLLASNGAVARKCADRSAVHFRGLDSPFGLAHCLEGRALIEHAAGDPSAAIDPLTEAIAILAEVGNRGCTAHALEATAAIVADRGDLLDAARLVGAAAELRGQVGQDHRPWEREGLARTAAAFAAAPNVDLDGAITEGRSFTMEAAVSFAHASLERCRVAARTGTSDDPQQRLGLTKREGEVLNLLVEGHSNRSIAQQLFVSVKTVERQLGDLYRKLGVANRTQAAAYALRHGTGRASS